MTKLRHVPYEETQSPNTDTHLAVDEKIRTDQQRLARPAMREGFAASSGVLNEVAETGGRAKNSALKDDPRPDRTPDDLEKEHSGLADA